MLVLVLDTSTPAVTAALAEVTAAAPADDTGSAAPNAGSAAPNAGSAASVAGPVALGAAARSGVVVRAERLVVDGRAHGELLAPQVCAVLAAAGARPGDLAAIVAGLGPGPFTGLRVGLMTAAGMGQALGIATYGVCSLDAIGLAAGPGKVLVATDARRREVYWATYADGVRTVDPNVSRPADLIGPDGVSGAVDRAVGEGAATYADVLGRPREDGLPAALGLPIGTDLLYPPAWALAVLAADRVRARAPGERLVPLYLRRPDAVEPAARKPARR